MPTTVNQYGKRHRFQLNGTPWRYPINNGGSPKGDNKPPIFATKKIKKTRICFTYNRLRLILSNGLIKSMLAPVVPIKLASIAPAKRKKVLAIGVAFKLIDNEMPPVIIYKEAIIKIKKMYSSIDFNNSSGQ